MASGPLNWLRVVDCTTGRLTMAGGLLAEWGAEVTKVEPPEGDALRATMPTVYATNDRGKRSVTLDLETDEGRDRFLTLLASADVLLESWEPGVADRLGLTYPAIHAQLPRLVHCSISGWGEGAYDRQRPADEPLVDAWIGTMGDQAGYRDGPIYYGMPMSSTGASYLAVIGSLGALYRRFDDGIGRRVETSLVDGALSFLSCIWRDADVPLPVPQLLGRNLVDYVRCGDGKYLGVHSGSVGGFDRLLQALGLDDRIPPSIPGMSTFSQVMTEEEAAIFSVEAPKMFASKPRDEWERILVEADVVCVPCLLPGELFDDPQVISNDMAVEVDDPYLGPVTQIGVATTFSLTPGAIQGPAPRLGQHTDEVFAAGGPKPSAPPAAGARDDRPVLDGVRVLDLGQYYAGPFGPRLLADLGADVIKLEPLIGDPGFGQGWGETANFRKRSIAVDLKADAGREIAERLIAWADVVHHNMRPGVAERLGLGYEQARQINEAIVYDFAPGWGTTGPNRFRPGFAPMYSGITGVAFEVAGEGNPPIRPVGHEDPGNGLLGASGILAALLHRRHEGGGQLIEHSQLNATMTHMRHVVRSADGTFLGATGLDGAQLGTGPLDRLYRTKDGWVVIVANTDDRFRALCKALGCSELAVDEHFADGEARGQHAGELAALLEPTFAGLTTTEAVAALAETGVPHEIAKADNREAFFRDPVNLENGRVASWPESRRGHVREVDHLIRFSDATRVPARPRPGVGEHTAEVLLALGYSADEINDMYASGVIR